VGKGTEGRKKGKGKERRRREEKEFCAVVIFDFSSEKNPELTDACKEVHIMKF